MPCAHIWIRQSAAQINAALGDGKTVTTTRYLHKCPRCGRLKTTMRTRGPLPQEIRWKREMEKLLIRARSAGYQIVFQDTLLSLDKITVHAL